MDNGAPTLIDQIKSYFSSTKVLLFLVLGGVLITIPLIFFMIYGYQSSKKAATTVGKVTNIAPLAPSESPSQTPVAFLDFSTDTIDFSQKTPQSTGVDIIVNSPTEKVSGAEIELTYDPSVITNVTLTPAIDAKSFFGEKVLVTALSNDTANGKITFSIQVPTLALARSGRGKIATLAFTPVKKAGVKDAKIQFTKDKSALIKQTATSREFLPTGRIDLDVLF